MPEDAHESVHRELEKLRRAGDKRDWRLDALDGWRKELDHRVSILESQIVTDREAVRLRQALDDQARKAEQARRSQAAGQTRIRLTKVQTVGAAAVGLVTAADFIRGIVAGG